MKPQQQDRAGLLYGFAAYGMWGLVPLFWPLLEPANAVEILAHRMVWSLAAVGLILLALRRWAWIRPLLREPRRLGLIAIAASVISVNWGLYIWGVNSGHVVETALGYFINPLVSIAFGVLLLRERLRPAQWAAVGVGALAVVVLSIGYGKLPWIALTLAFTFATYGLVKKRIGLGGLESLAAETAVQFLPALGFLVFLGARGDSTFGSGGAGHSALLASCGVITALPLICFGASAVRLPLSTIGMLQYIAPIFQFTLGLVVFHESMPPERWAGFALVWLALTLLTWDALHTSHRARRELADVAARAGLSPAGAASGSDAVPEAVAGAAAGVMPDVIPGAGPKTAPDAAPDAVPDAVPDLAPGTAPEKHGGSISGG
ncbi:EamA family transporter RarD [Streptomyces sp. NA02950]|uniref:EamA family transporter RarD n=1 Tax=Streptomyces sp. NA02950 TaxID=2742137 RepID=UPI00159130B3|nr:EamA family transporter RarD [Streptomyces sp. NA02950]QKV93338.1 EamA family transporter RarD [Streptomyces sp. NA02950]